MDPRSLKESAALWSEENFLKKVDFSLTVLELITQPIMQPKYTIVILHYFSISTGLWTLLLRSGLNIQNMLHQFEFNANITS